MLSKRGRQRQSWQQSCTQQGKRCRVKRCLLSRFTASSQPVLPVLQSSADIQTSPLHDMRVHDCRLLNTCSSTACASSIWL